MIDIFKKCNRIELVPYIKYECEGCSAGQAFQLQRAEAW